MQDLFTRKWGTGATGRIERERRRRIMLAVWAYAYEFEAVSLVSDAEFDKESYLVDPSTNTGRADLDHFFRTSFAAYTGQWIYKHPELDKVRDRYDQWYGNTGTRGEKIHRGFSDAYIARNKPHQPQYRA